MGVKDDFRTCFWGVHHRDSVGSVLSVNHVSTEDVLGYFFSEFLKIENRRILENVTTKPFE